ncbi:VanZ family protein [Microbacterium foliorum]|uniref:VanZ family protein n=1 Tax=Microbacterium foliorum TaxID=104336 RepID=UPI0028D2EF0B|nr:VanZ family protein [Microbacterium foliorum]
MAGWTWQAWVGLIGGGLIFAAVLVPILVVQVRRYGALSFPRLLGAAAVSVYTVALVAYTLLPLPELRDNCGAGGGGLELVPGHSVGDILRETQGLSLLGVPTSRATLQVLFNVALFVPFGLIARRYWNRGPWVSILLGALVSFGIETTQLTGVWGLYECAYRVADVDDLIANTAGAAIGVLLAPLLLAWMPSARSLRATRATPRPVTVWRRWFGMILDAVAVNIAIALVSLVVVLPKLLLSGGDGPSVPDDAFEAAIVAAGAAVLVLVIPAVVSTGASIGQRLVWLTPEWSEGRRPLARSLARAGVVGLPYVAATALDGLPEAVPFALQTVVGIVAIVSALVVAIAVISVPFTRGHRGLSAALTGAELRDSRS